MMDIIIKLQTPKGGATTKTKIFAIMCIILLLVCLVACNNRDPNGDLVTTGRKPFAKPDPSNPYDKKWLYDCAFDKDIVADNVLTISFTNTESLNNLFYDFVPEDFPGLDLKEVTEYHVAQLERVRQQVLYGEKYEKYKEGRVEEYNRTIKLEFNFNDYAKLEEICKQLYPRQEFICVYPENKGGSFFAEPNDAKYNTNQRTISNLINLEEAWDHTTGSSSVKVGVLDSGVLGTHADLVGNLSTTHGYYNASSLLGNQLLDEKGHGTPVAGIIGATGNNSIGISGVCWDVTLISLKVSKAVLVGPDTYDSLEYLPYLIEAIEYATENDIPILSFSGGWYENELNAQEISNLGNAIANYPGLFVCAAGNNGIDMDASGATKVYPACYTYSNILTVGASTSSDERFTSSNYGATSVDIFAPGVGIYTTNFSGGYGGFSYTSAATPVVSGIAGLLLSYDPTLSPIEIKRAILNGADPVSVLSDKCVSGGRVNAWGAIEQLRVNYTYTNLTGSGHRYTCTICNITNTEDHTWTSFLDGYKCIYCRALAKYLEIIRPNINRRYQLLLQQASSVSDNPNFYYVNVDEHSVIIYDNGKYYLVYECDEQGLPKHQLSTDFLAFGYTIEGNQIVRTGEIEVPPIYEPVVKTA